MKDLAGRTVLLTGASTGLGPSSSGDCTEIDVVRLPLRASLKVLAVAAGFFMAVARSSGANSASDGLSERQKSKR